MVALASQQAVCSLMPRRPWRSPTRR